MLRKIKKSEISSLARIAAECFYDYPVYQRIFPNEKKRLDCLYYHFQIRLYLMQNYSYVTENEDMLISVKRPGDKNHSLFGLLVTPRFLFGLLKYMPLSFLPNLISYESSTRPALKKYYDPKSDDYIGAACVLKKSRFSGVFFSALRELDQGRPVCAETHTARNVRLYQYLGAEVCDAIEWKGIPHYILRYTGSAAKQTKNSSQT